MGKRGMRFPARCACPVRLRLRPDLIRRPSGALRLNLPYPVRTEPKG